jgi:nitrogen fixation NifU-like protein
MYTPEVMDSFMNPKNYGEIENPSGLGTVGNIVCGDIMYLYLDIKKNKDGEDYIHEVRFKTLGCAAAIATSSKVTELVKGKTVKEAMEITNKNVMDSLGGLPKQKIHCSLLAEEALKEAIYDYLKKNNFEIPLSIEHNHKKVSNDSCHMH